MCARSNVRTLARAVQGSRKAVITQGADATVIANGDATETIAVKGNPWTLEKADLVDTNGAGDAASGIASAPPPPEPPRGCCASGCGASSPASAFRPKLLGARRRAHAYHRR